ncbi:UbiX family flavin prenyltransferase [Paenibacillus yanchengensis]|uniref:Flavin prenyltransferase UbiX n=1 Tax=Paenibacillus yanchengensis TaxID=2035833 RepID=A0ABW4YK18_9BACL
MVIDKKVNRWIVGITGASGAIYGVRLIEHLLQMQYQVHLVVTDAGWRVIKEELGIDALRRAVTLTELFGSALEDGQLIYYPNGDIGAAIASGSFQNAGMIIMPCSMGTLASIAHGISNNLMARAADVALKEKRSLIIVPRETPIHAIHLDNMANLARLGVHIVPAMPAFYFGPQSMDDMISFMVGKVLDAAGIEHTLYRRWKEEEQ